MTAKPATTSLPTPLSPLATAAFLYVYIAWGATYMALHFALESFPPFLIAGCRHFLAGSLLLVLLGIFQRRSFHLGNLGEWRDALTVGTLLLVGGNGLVAWAQQYVPTSMAALIFGSMPLCIILFDWLRPHGTRPSLRTAVGLAFGFVGLCILIKPSAMSPDTRMEIWAKFALVLATCSWSAGAVYSRHVHATGSPLLPMARQMISGGLGLLLVGTVRGEWTHLSVEKATVTAWLGFLYLVIFGSLLGFTAYVWLMRISTPARVSTISYVNLVVAVLLGWTLGGEPMTPRILVGAGIIIGSVVLVLKKGVSREVVTPSPPEEA